jgi:hypothetical protein
MHKLPLRCRDGRWEVLVPRGHGEAETWITCRREAEARQLAASGNLAFEAIERKRSGEEIASELEACARLFFTYGCIERSMWLAEHAKFARGEPSVFGDGAAI